MNPRLNMYNNIDVSFRDEYGRPFEKYLHFNTRMRKIKANREQDMLNTVRDLGEHMTEVKKDIPCYTTPVSILQLNTDIKQHEALLTYKALLKHEALLREWDQRALLKREALLRKAREWDHKRREYEKNFICV